MERIDLNKLQDLPDTTLLLMLGVAKAGLKEWNPSQEKEMGVIHSAIGAMEKEMRRRQGIRRS